MMQGHGYVIPNPGCGGLALCKLCAAEINCNRHSDLLREYEKLASKLEKAESLAALYSASLAQADIESKKWYAEVINKDAELAFLCAAVPEDVCDAITILKYSVQKHGLLEIQNNENKLLALIGSLISRMVQGVEE